MEFVSLEDLILSHEELELAHRQVKDIAYSKWELAGCPSGCDTHFWKEAELEWIEFYYVPDRYVCVGPAAKGTLDKCQARDRRPNKAK